MQVFGRGHQVTRNGASVYVTRCQATEVLPRTHTNCTNEIPAMIPMKPIAIDDVKVMNLGLGRSIYSPTQLEEFACFQKSQVFQPARAQVFQIWPRRV